LQKQDIPGVPGYNGSMLVNELPRTVVIYPDPRLRKRCTSIRAGEFDESLAELAKRMLEVMKANAAWAGRAAGGHHPRMFVCNPRGAGRTDHVYVNPVLTDLTARWKAKRVACRSPRLHDMVRCARRCRMQAQDVNGQPIEAEAEDQLARIWQHETDHLDGRLLGRMNASDKIANKRLIAQMKKL
jgi:peptide deformylase